MDQYLEDIVKEQEVVNKDDLKKILEKLVEETEKKEVQQNLKHIAEKFILEKFTRKIQMQHNGLKFLKKSVYDST